MNFKTTIVLLALLVIVGAYVFFVEKDATTTYERQQWMAQQHQTQGTALFSAAQLPTESVVSVRIQRPGADEVVLHKRGQDWYQTRPVRFALNTWSTRQLVDDAAGLRYSQRFNPTSTTDNTGTPSLDQASLSPAKATLVLEVDRPQPAKQTIHLGRKALGGWAYAKINDDPMVYVVNDALHTAVLDQQVAQWRKRSFDVPKQSQADRVSLSHKGQTIQMVKAAGGWSFAPPHSGRVDEDAVQELLAGMSGVSITRFIMDQPADPSVYGLDAPTTILTARTAATTGLEGDKASTTRPSTAADGHGTVAQLATQPAEPITQTLCLGAPVTLEHEQYFATWSRGEGPGDVVFTVSEADTQRFTKSLDDLRDPRVTRLKDSDIRELTIQRAQQPTIKLLRSVEGWSFVQPGPGFEADSGVVSSLVESITQIRAQGYRPTVKVATEPTATITLGAIGQPEPDVLRIYPSDVSDRHLLLANNETTGYLVLDQAVARVFEPILSLRQRTLWELSADRLQRIAIEHTGGPVYTFDREQTVAPAGQRSTPSQSQPVQATLGSWQMAGTDRFESKAFNELLTRLLQLRVERWLDPPSQTDTPGSDPRIQVVIHGTDQERWTLLIDPDQRRGSLAGESSPHEHFALSQSIVNLVDSEFRDRTVLPISVGDIRSVTVTRAKTRSDHHDPMADDALDPDPAVRQLATTIECDRDGHYVSPEGQPIDQEAAGGLFDTLAGLRVKRYRSSLGMPRAIAMTIEITTRDERKWQLIIPGIPGYEQSANLGDRWFTLDADTLSKLSATLLEQEVDQ